MKIIQFERNLIKKKNFFVKQHFYVEDEYVSINLDLI